MTRFILFCLLAFLGFLLVKHFVYGQVRGDIIEIKSIQYVETPEIQKLPKLSDQQKEDYYNRLRFNAAKTYEALDKVHHIR